MTLDVISYSAAQVAQKRARAARLATLLDPQRIVPQVPAVIPTVGAPVASASTNTTGTTITSPQRLPFFTDTNGTNGAEGIVDSKRFTYRGWQPHRRDGTNWPVAEPRSPISTVQSASFPTSYEFGVYSALGKIELQLFNDAGARYQIFSDGLPVTQRSVTTATGTAFLLPVDYGAAGWHWIRLRTSRSPGFIAVIVGPNDTVIAHRQPPKGQMYVCGDSFCDGANGVGSLDTYVNTLSSLLGLRDVWIDGEGSTGFSNNGGSGTKEKYLPRIQRAATEPGLSPDIVVLQGSSNDFGFADATEQADVTACIQQVRSQWPNAYLVVTGVMKCAVISSGDLTNHNNVKTAAQAALAAGTLDLFIDPVADSWFTGTGRVGATTGTGNADLFRSSDGTHPTQDGHDYMADRVAQAIMGAIA